MNAHTSGLEDTARSIAEKVEQAKENVSATTSKAVEEGKEAKRKWWPF